MTSPAYQAVDNEERRMEEWVELTVWKLEGTGIRVNPSCLVGPLQLLQAEQVELKCGCRIKEHGKYFIS